MESALTAKGFVAQGGDHCYFEYWDKQGQRSKACTKTSRGSKIKVIADELLNQMAKQCGLTMREFLALVDCPMSRDDYEAILRQRDFLKG